MSSIKTYEKYPFWIVAVSSINALLIYVLGFIVMLEIEIIFALLFALYVVILEIRLIRNHCVNCYYYGKVCGFGKGVVSSIFFRKGIESFCRMQLTWRDIIPEIMISVIPVLAGIIVLIVSFKLYIFFSIIAILLLSFIGNGIVRGNLTCKYCKQRGLGCPADNLFNKKSNKYTAYEKSDDLSPERVRGNS